MSETCFCRHCGQSLHLTATACPKCGAIQPDAPSSKTTAALAIVAVTLAALTTAMVVLNDEPWDSDSRLGGAMFAIAAAVCGAISLHQRRPGKPAAIVSMVLAGVTLLALLGTR
jgi:hypothetical protein